MLKYDVLVVGAGIVGLAHAYTAAKQGLKVLVIEKDAACVGASIRNFGFVTVTGQKAGASWQRARRSRDVWAELAPQAGIEVVHQGLWLRAERPEAMAVLEAFMQTDMACGCELLSPQQAQARHPALQTRGLQGVLYSPHELRVESRLAVGQLTRWLAEALGVHFQFSEAVLSVETGRVTTARGTYQAERVVVCTNAELNGLFAQTWADDALRLCQLQMLRVRPQPGFKLHGSVMGDLSLIRYEGYSELSMSRKLKERLLNEEPACLSHGIHLIAVQSADGTLVVGDSHHYGASVGPFALQEVDDLILRLLKQALNLSQLEVVERWVGVYPSSATEPCLVKTPDAQTRVVAVTGGTGASTAFGLAEQVFADWH